MEPGAAPVHSTGRKITYGNCFKQDEFGRPLQVDFQETVLPKLNRQVLIDKMCALIVDKIKLPVSLTDQGLLWRIVVTADGTSESGQLQF